MKRYFLFSLCAITPLLLRAEGMINLFENEAEEACVYENREVPPDAKDPLYSIVLETQETHKDNTEQKPVSLEIIDLADVQIEQKSKNDLSKAPTQQAVPINQDSKENLADAKQPNTQSMQPERGNEGSSKDTLCPDSTMCMPDIEPHQINVRHTEHKGIGYNRGYTTLEGLFTFSRDKYIPFLDLRGHVFDDGRLAANAGIGTRYVLDPSKSMVGINTYYDYRNLKHAHFNQWGVGLEGFYGRWELRLNGYLPVGTKRVVSDHHLNGITFKKFQGNNLWINENYTDKVIAAKKGGDLEIGVHPFKIMRDYDCLIAAGPYYFGGEGASGWGGKVRLKVEFAKYLFVELADSYDKVFHNRFQGTLMLSLPFGGKKCYPKKTRNAATSDCFADNIMAWRGVQPVQRQEIIVAKKQTQSYIIDPIAINPATDDPVFITFVNNQDIFAGDGTFEHPYSTLANAQANTGQGDVIYVFAGDGTAYTDGWFLLDGQRFLGSAAAHDFSTTKGTVTVPIQTNLFPLIANTTTPFAGITTTATGGTTYNEVSGISVQQIAGHSALHAETQNITITNNFFLGVATNQATVLVVSSGNALIDSNILLNNSMNSGIFFLKDGANNPAATVNAIISNNTATKFAGSGIAINANTGATGILNLTLTGNVVTDTTSLSTDGHGVNIFFNNSPVSMIATINSNKLFNNAVDGLKISQLVPGTSRAQVFDNTIFNNGLDNLLFEVGIGGGAPGQNLCLNVHDNVSVLPGTGGSGYHFSTNPAFGTIFTEPFVNNVGTITGSTTSVPPCFCEVGCTLPSD